MALWPSEPGVAMAHVSTVSSHDRNTQLCTDRDELLSKSDAELLNMTMNGNTIGKCEIARGAPTYFCNYYTIAVRSNTTDYRGWPRNVDDRGTGCVYEPGLTPCYYIRDEYRNWPIEEREAMCASQDVLTNAVAQLRHAIANCACDESTLAPFTPAPVAPSPSSSATVSLAPATQLCADRDELLSKSDSELLNMTMNGNTIGKCEIARGAPTYFCNYYTIAVRSNTTDYRGWPRNVDDRGTGCVYEPGLTPCYYIRDEYRNWPIEEREAMCASQDVLTNAVAQLRHAIANQPTVLVMKALLPLSLHLPMRRQQIEF